MFKKIFFQVLLMLSDIIVSLSIVSQCISLVCIMLAVTFCRAMDLVGFSLALQNKLMFIKFFPSKIGKMTF